MSYDILKWWLICTSCTCNSQLLYLCLSVWSALHAQPDSPDPHEISEKTSGVANNKHQHSAHSLV